MRSMRLCAGAAFALLLLGCAASAERGDSQTGRAPEWTASLRQTFGLERIRVDRCARPDGAPASQRRLTRQSLRLQAAVALGDLVSKLHRMLGDDWGRVWFDRCDGRFKVGVPPAPASELRAELGAARRVLNDADMLGRTDFVTVHSTARELSEHQEELNDRFERLLGAGMISSGQEHSRNAVIVHAWKRVADVDRRAIERAAKAAPVKVIIEWTDTRPTGRTASDRLGVDDE
jgi:hypothetical protein